MKNAKDIIKQFYAKSLTVNNSPNVDAEMSSFLAENFQAINAKEIKGKVQFIKDIQGVWKVIPDLKWEPQEILQDGNRIIVRSICSGTPKGEFLGMMRDGTKSFKTMSIDIYTIENEKIVKVYHIEEWTTAMAQMMK